MDCLHPWGNSVAAFKTHGVQRVSGVDIFPRTREKGLVDHAISAGACADGRFPAFVAPLEESNIKDGIITQACTGPTGTGDMFEACLMENPFAPRSSIFFRSFPVSPLPG